MGVSAILDRAFDKAVKSTPGNPVKLYPMEEKILHKALWRSYKLHKIRRTIYKYDDLEVQRIGFVRIGKK